MGKAGGKASGVSATNRLGGRAAGAASAASRTGCESCARGQRPGRRLVPAARGGGRGGRGPKWPLGQGMKVGMWGAAQTVADGMAVGARLEKAGKNTRGGRKRVLEPMNKQQTSNGFAGGGGLSGGGGVLLLLVVNPGWQGGEREDMLRLVSGTANEKGVWVFVGTERAQARCARPRQLQS